LITRIAFAYVRSLLVLEILLFAASLSLHLSVFILGANKAYADYAVPLFRATVIVGIPVIAFAKDGMWTDQIKRCPRWMWKGSLILGAYALLIACVQLIFRHDAALSGQSLILSGFPIGFDAISLCILHSVLWSGYLEKPEVVRRTLHSVVFVTLGAVLFLAYRAGYLHHSRSN
jgi:hypothetical protein